MNTYLREFSNGEREEFGAKDNAAALLRTQKENQENAGRFPYPITALYRVDLVAQGSTLR